MKLTTTFIKPRFSRLQDCKLREQHLSLIKKVASTSKPLIISTGMVCLGELDDFVRIARDAGNTQLVLLKCTRSLLSIELQVV